MNSSSSESQNDQSIKKEFEEKLFKNGTNSKKNKKKMKMPKMKSNIKYFCF